MPTALFVSPHLDDVAFSCGGTALALRRAGWRTVVVTAFTASVDAPSGFALACQLDKGLAADVDYLALRRAEDEEFATRVGLARTWWLDLAEAPHRGYESAPALFGPFVEHDDVAAPLVAALSRCLDEEQPDVVLAPQALGGHVDHRRVADAIVELVDPDRAGWYRDVPYAIHQPDAVPSRTEAAALPEVAIDIAGEIEAKGHAATAYATQLGFQFGGATCCMEQLTRHAADEAARLGLPGHAEVVRTLSSIAF